MRRRCGVSAEECFAGFLECGAKHRFGSRTKQQAGCSKGAADRIYTQDAVWK